MAFHRRHLAAACALALACGCNAVTDFDRFHAGSDGGGSPDGGTDSGGGTDAGPCEDPVPEECNVVDDDCDGDADEGFDLETDPAHCGACDAACEEVPGAMPGCVDGSCSPACDDGLGDCDDDYATGCETDLGTAAACGSCGDA